MSHLLNGTYENEAATAFCSRLDAIYKAQERRRRSTEPPLLTGYGAGSYIAGAGSMPLPPGASYDYFKDVGRVDLNSVVRCGLSWIGDNLPSAILRVGRQIQRGEKKGQWSINTTHPANRTFLYPSPAFSAWQTWAAVASAIKLYGNAYLIKIRGNDDVPYELWWVPTHRVTVIAGKNPRKPVDRYLVWGTAGPPQEYVADDVVHIKDGVDPENPLLGIGRLMAVLRCIAAINVGESRTAASLRNAHYTGILTPKGGDTQWNTPVDNNEMLGLRTKIERETTGEKSGRIVTSDIPVDFLSIGFSPDDMGLETILDRPEAMICAALGVPALVLGLPSSSATRTYSNLAEARRHAWEDGIVPLQKLIADALATQWLYRVDSDTGELIGEFGDPEGLQIWWDTTEVPALREDINERATRAVAVFEASGMTWNEFRTEINLPALDETRGNLFKHEIGMQVALELTEAEGRNKDEAEEDQQEEEPKDEAEPIDEAA